VDAFLLRALAAEPAERFADAAAMGAALGALKAKLAPDVSDADLARLMADAFPREKMVEGRMLEDLLRDDPTQARTQREFPAVLAPPTALAFEHTGLEAPEDYVPSEALESPEASAESVLAQEHVATEALESAKVLQAASTAAASADVTPAPVKLLSASEDVEDEVTETAVAPRPPLAPAVRARDARRSPEDAEPTMPGAGLPGRPVGAGAATEALETSKILGAIARASGGKPALSGGTAPSPRRMTRETQVGFGVDISQGVDARTVEARRRDLVRAITGEDEAAEAPEQDLGGTRRQGVRGWAMAALFAGACGLGFGVVWLFTRGP
jgi:serine/threonine-protein kinase